MSDWSEERVSRLRRLWSEGLSASQVAERLGGVTRNAVIAKVHRLGLSRRAPSRARYAGASTPAPARPYQPRTGAAKSTKYASDPDNFAPAERAPGPNAVRFMARKSGQCPFPISGAGAAMIVCGEPSAVGSWCASCAAIVTRKETAGERRDARALIKAA